MGMTKQEVREAIFYAIGLPIYEWHTQSYQLCAAAFCGTHMSVVRSWIEFGTNSELIVNFFNRSREVCNMLQKSLNMHDFRQRFEFFVLRNKELGVRPSDVLWRKDGVDILRHEISFLADPLLAPPPPVKD